MVAPSILNCAMVKHLSEDKELQKKLRAEPELIPAAVEEFVRLYTPYRGFARTALRPTEISGQVVPTGEPITITYAAANRDPTHFQEPDKFILNRDNINSHLGFSRGRHRCAGMALARMMLKVFLEILLRKTLDFDVEGECTFARLPEVALIGCPMKFVPSHE
jgi:cytochrome P450